MTPKQKVALAARETGEQAAVLSAWLEQNTRRVGFGADGLRQALLGLSADVDAIQQALERPPGIGVVAATGAGQAWLVASILAAGEQRQTDAGRPPAPAQEAYRSLLAAGPGTGAALRLRPAPASGAPDGFPFAVSLLGIADLAQIIVRAWFSAFPGASTRLPDHDRIAVLYDEVGRNLATTAVPGLPARDVHALRDGLAVLYPEAPGLRELSALGYWEDLAEVSGHLPPAERARVLSMLWGGQEELTRLFELLADAQSRLGFAAEAFCPREALLAQGPSAGWSVRHPESIIDAAALAGLGDDAGTPLRIAGRYGHRASLPRSTLAALAAEVAVAAPPPLGAAAVTELVAFPFPGPPGDLALPLADRRGRSWLLARDDVLQAFVRAKAAHLVERACRRHEVTSLVVAVDPGTEHDDWLAAAVGDWIDLTQGATPHDRELSRTGLFVVATRPDQPAAGPGPAEAEAAAGQRWHARLGGALAEAVGATLDWPSEWVPGQPFANIHLFQHPAAPAAPGRDRPPAAGPLERRAVGAEMLQALVEIRGQPRHYAHDHETIEHQLASADGGAAALVRALAPASQVETRHRQLRRCLAARRRNLRTHLYRLDAADDPGEVAEWRRQLATVAGHQLERVCRRHRLGRLLQALGMQEAELAALYWRRRPHAPEVGLGEPESRGVVTDGLASPRSAMGQARIGGLAAAAVAHWFATMRRIARAGRLGRDVGLAEPILQFIVDEIATGAARLGLERRLADALTAGLAETGGKRVDALLASCAGPAINGFLERLEIDTPAISWSRALARVRARAPLLRDLSSPWTLVPQMSSRPLAASWCDAFGTLVEANIAAQRFATGSGTDPELTRLLARMPVDIVEADL